MELDKEDVNTYQQPSFSNKIDITKSVGIYRFRMLLIVIVIVFILMVFWFVVYLLRNKDIPKRSFFEITNNTPIPTKASKKEEEKIFFAENGFSFYYPRSFEMFQAWTDVIFWRNRNTPGEYNASLILRYSGEPFPQLVKGGTFNIYIKSYPAELMPLIIDSLEEAPIALGSKQSTLYTIRCGIDCHYSLVRFASNGVFYEFAISINSEGLLTRFNNILDSFSFYDANVKEWRTYKSQEGHYIVRYPSGSTFLEKVYTSVDGVRGYSKNNIVIMNIKNNSSSGFFKVNFEKIGAMKLDEYVKKNGCSSDMISMTKRFELNREPAIFQSTACGPAGSSNVYIKHNDFIYIIGDMWPEDIMLRNFKFID